MSAYDFADLDEANDFLSTLKFYPFGTAHEGSFELEESLETGESPYALHMRQMGYDSTAFDFEAEYFDESIELHTQDFTLQIHDESWAFQAELLRYVCRLVGYAMAHEGLEWLRFEDGTYVHDPHNDGDVSVQI